MQPLVDVNIAVYNHAPYLEKTLDGVLAQKTNFGVRMVIGDDCSTDGSIDILKRYEAQYPDKMKVIYQPKNIGLGVGDRNGIIILKNSTAKYIALLDGDDYWTDPLKLQTQVDFLEANSNYALTFHDVSILYKGRKARSYHWDAPDTSDIGYLLREGNYISTLSSVFRNSPRILEFLNKFPNAPFGDYLIYIAVAQEGLMKFFPQRMGVYRVHHGGSWSLAGIQKATERVIGVLKMLYVELPPELKDYVRIRYLTVLEELFRYEGTQKTNTDLDKLVVPEMGIESFVIKYIKQAAEQKASTKYFVKNIPAKTLLKALVQKPLNRLPI